MNISKTYVVTDMHFFHKKMGEFAGRPSNFDQLIINNWKSTVQPQDIVIDLGDVTWGNKEQLSIIMKQLPGTKILVRGNHDKNHSNNWFIEAGYAAVFEKVQISRVVLSHKPAILNKKEIELGIINVHGHFHNAPKERWEKELVNRLTENHFLLSLEEVNYRPISLDNIIKRKYIKKSILI